MKFPNPKAAAQFYFADKGWSVMPVGRLTDRGEPKAPYLGAGQIIPLRTEALDTDGINAIWSMYPAAGVAVLTGKLSGISVIDVDFVQKQNGIAVPGSPLADHADIPTNTLMARSGSGGLHFFFKYSPLADGRKNLRDHIDIKSEGGYIILPPSKHASGREYEWLNDEPLAEFPEHLLKLNSTRMPGMPSSPTVSAKSYWERLLHGLAESEAGGRNNYIASVAGVCFANGQSVDDAIKYLIPFGQMCQPAVDIETIERTVRSAYSTALRKQDKPIEDDKIEVVDLWQAADEVAADVGDKKFPLGLYGPPKGFEEFPPETWPQDPITRALNGGMILGDLGVISGHTGRGKTLLAQIITQNLVAFGEKSLWFEFELMPPEMRERFIKLKVNKGMVFIPRDVVTKNLDGSMEFVEAAIIKAKKEIGSRFVFLDLLDRFRPRNDKEKKSINTNLSSYLGLIAEQLKDLAVKHRVVIVLMAHTRKPQQGVKPIPDLHDISNSGGIAQNADWVIMVHRRSWKEMGMKPKIEVKKSDPDSESDSESTTRSLEADFAEDPDSLSNNSKIVLQKNRRTGKYASVEISYNADTGEISPAEVYVSPEVQAAEMAKQRAVLMEKQNQQVQPVPVFASKPSGVRAVAIEAKLLEEEIAGGMEF